MGRGESVGYGSFILCKKSESCRSRWNEWQVGTLTGVVVLVGVLLSLFVRGGLVLWLFRVWWDSLVTSFIGLSVADVGGRHGFVVVYLC